MLKRTRKTKKRPLAEINVVPYIDVMLVLLVIFMITAPLLTQGINVNLPEAQAKAVNSENALPIVVSVDRAGRYFLNTAQQPSEPVSAQALMTEVAAQLQIAQEKHEPRTVYVKGDRAVDYGRVVQAMSLLQKAGAKEVGLITESMDHQ